MRKILFLFIIFFAVSSGYSQYYGLLGKRVIINLEMTTSPAYLQRNFISDALEQKNVSSRATKYLGMNFFANPSVEYAAWKKGTVGVGYIFFTSPFDGIQHNVYFEDPSVILSYNMIDGYSNFEGCKGMLTSHGFNLYYKQYLKNSVAPIGHYFKFNLDGFFIRYFMDGLPDYTNVPLSKQTVFYCPEYDINSPKPLSDIQKGKTALFGFKVEYGYDFWPVSFMKMSLGVSLGSTFGGYNALYDFDFFGDALDATYKNYAKGRILGAYFLQFKLGIGFLAF